MPRYMTLGEIPPKRHINFHASDGARCVISASFLCPSGLSASRYQ